jgi:hypothetical protein
VAEPYDDFTVSVAKAYGAVPGGLDMPRVVELEVQGPGDVNRLASVTGVAWLGYTPDWLFMPSQPGMDDGVVVIDTGYRLHGRDRWEKGQLLGDDSAELMHSTYVAFANIAGTGQGFENRDGTIDFVETSLEHDQDDSRLLDLRLTVKVDLNADIMLAKLSYNVVLLFNSERPPALDFEQA